MLAHSGHLETTQMSLNGQTVKPTMVVPYNGILLSSQREQTEWYLTVVLLCIFLIPTDVILLFLCSHSYTKVLDGGLKSQQNVKSQQHNSHNVQHTIEIFETHKKAGKCKQ